MTKGLKPVMTIDVWEHAYYIDYRNRRADFIKSYWELIDWDKVADRIFPANTTAPPATTYMIRPRAIPKAASHPARHSKTSRTTGMPRLRTLQGFLQDRGREIGDQEN